jgi:hypothetical protein
MTCLLGNYHTLTLNSHENEHLNKKIVVLKGCTFADDEFHSPTVPVFRVEGLFMKRLLSPSGELYSKSTCNGVISPKSFHSVPPLSRTKVIDPLFVSLVSYAVDFCAELMSRSPSTNVCTSNYFNLLASHFLSTEDPPPCNEHYLMSCSKGVRFIFYKHWRLIIKC